MSEGTNTELDFALNLDFSQILTNPILDIAARFWEDERYQAFRVCYRSMRRIDDLVDERKAASGGISDSEATRLRDIIQNWLETVRKNSATDPFQKEFLAAREKFVVPLWPWERLCRAMVYDLNHNGFESFRAFLRYAEGAAVAPASVFMHLCGVRPGDNGFCPPEYDIRKAARELALFSYIVHIIRDFQKDQLQNLNYFADDLLARRSLNVSDLTSVAQCGQIGEAFRDLIRQYQSFAEYYRQKARQTINRTAPCLQPRYRLSLEIIYGLYLQIFERIDPDQGRFTGKELNPSPEEVQVRMSQIVKRFLQPRNP